MTTVCIIDIDTTIANNDHRAFHLVKDETGKIPKECWDKFLDKTLMLLDSPQQHALDVLNYMRNHGYTIVFLTGRNETHKDVTEEWLKTHMGWKPHYEALYMRTAADAGQPASVFKKKCFVEKIQPTFSFNTSFVFFEDDPYVLPVWKSYGLVLKCPEVWEHMNPVLVDEPEASWRR